MRLSITETPNELTKDIDIAEPLKIVQLLEKTDTEIFHGYESFPNICNPVIIAKIEDCIERIKEVVRSKEKKIILISGAGTSGRLAMFVCRTFNQLLSNLKERESAIPDIKIFQYLIAGGDKALIAAQEGAEDDPHKAVNDLRNIIGDAKYVGYFGVTCGLSAPYVAGQLDYLVKQFDSNKLNGFACLLGFNPAECARNIPIENWHKTFQQVLNEVQQSKNFILLNPIIGPEPITGSTRMKSGSATKILLEKILYEATISRSKSDALQTSEYFKDFEEAKNSVYHERENIAKLIDFAGEALRNKGHIYYIGKPPYGILGLIDASECPPTYGADIEDVRGFLDGGWDELLGKGKDLSSSGPAYRIGMNEFLQTKLSKLTQNDLIIMLGEGHPYELLKTVYKTENKSVGKEPTYANLLQLVKDMGAKTAIIGIQSEPEIYESEQFSYLDCLVTPIIPGESSFKELGMKLILNAITTGAHIRVGKVYQNRMIDLKISNNKLYYRTIHIISTIMKVNEQTAKECMLKSIYETNELKPEILEKSISTHIQNATSKSKIVPKAMLMSTGKYNYMDTTDALAKDPIVRNILLQWVSH